MLAPQQQQLMKLPDNLSAEQKAQELIKMQNYIDLEKKNLNLNKGSEENNNNQIEASSTANVNEINKDYPRSVAFK